MHPGTALTAILAALLTVSLAGCGPTHHPIPGGAQQVHVVVTDTEVRLDPSTVSAGDVYLVLDAPAEGSIAFVQAKATADATPGPLTDADIDRLAQGDTQGTSIGGMDAGGCSPEQNAEARGQVGYCGNVLMVTLTPGTYAVLGGTPEDARPMAVLEVLP